jgi:hypothetical protein
MLNFIKNIKIKFNNNNNNNNNMMKWFENLYGFEEYAYQSRNDIINFKKTQENFTLSAEDENDLELNGNLILNSITNSKSFPIGKFSSPSLKELRLKGKELIKDNNIDFNNSLIIEHRPINDILKMHSQFPNSVFQAASQFNNLEFPNPKCIPENGISQYPSDRTQGPACAMACASGTLYRNYFVKVDNNEKSTRGQTEFSQLNNLSELEELIDNKKENYFQIINGYSYATEESLIRLSQLIEFDREILLESIKIGLHEDVGVVYESRSFQTNDIINDIRVTQCYCSALSCAYSGIRNNYWQSFAKLILEANYEATLWAALINSLKNDGNIRNNEVYLTFLGGGVFGS